MFGMLGVLHAFLCAHDSLLARQLNDGPNNLTSASAKRCGRIVRAFRARHALGLAAFAIASAAVRASGPAKPWRRRDPWVESGSRKENASNFRRGDARCGTLPRAA